MACMAVQRFHQGQHGIKVVGADGEVECGTIPSAMFSYGIWTGVSPGQFSRVRTIFSCGSPLPSPPGSRDSRERSRR